MPRQPDTPTPAHMSRRARKPLRDGRTGYPDNQGGRSAQGGRRENPARAGTFVRSGSRDPYHGRCHAGRVCGSRGIGGRHEAVFAARSDLRCLRPPIALWGSRPRPSPPRSAMADSHCGRQLESSPVTGTGVILLNTPWNPVGTVLTRRELEEVMGFAEKHDYRSSATRSTSP